MAYNEAPADWWKDFIDALPARTAKLAVVRADQAEAHGRRNTEPPEMLVRVTPTSIVAKTAVAD